MNKILSKTFTVITVFLAISTPRSSAQSSPMACAEDRFNAAMGIIQTNSRGSCLYCHGTPPVPGAPSFSGMLHDEQSWVPHYVTPGNPGASLLWQRLNGIGNVMPPPPSGRLTQNEIDTIANWIANFDQTTVTVLAQPSNGGTVTGGGTFPIGSSRTITASANSGWTFVQWNDGNTAASRTITVPSCDVTYTAFFQAQAPPTAAFFMGEIPLGNGVYYLQLPNGNVFGYYAYLTDRRWIYHIDMGYEYWFDANDGHRGIFFYDLTSTHFFYTSPSFPFPFLYDFNLHTVLYYYPNPNLPGRYTSHPRYFYNFATHQIITM